MLFKLKPGVSLKGAQPELVIGLIAAASVYEGMDNGMGKYPCVVTSITDGKHSEGSLHYKGLAADLRTRVFGTHEAMEDCVELLQVALNGEPNNFVGEWDVVLERDHIHMEYDPK